MCSGFILHQAKGDMSALTQTCLSLSQSLCPAPRSCLSVRPIWLGTSFDLSDLFWIHLNTKCHNCLGSSRIELFLCISTDKFCARLRPFLKASCRNCLQSNYLWIENSLMTLTRIWVPNYTVMYNPYVYGHTYTILLPSPSVFLKPQLYSFTFTDVHSFSFSSLPITRLERAVLASVSHPFCHIFRTLPIKYLSAKFIVLLQIPPLSSPWPWCPEILGNTRCLAD